MTDPTPSIETWQIELKEAIRDTRELASFIGHKIPETSYPLMVPRRLAKKIKESPPLQKQFLPHTEENENTEKNYLDPIGDEKYSPAPQIIHRYPSRALFLPTSSCPVICRYCFRKNELHSNTEFLRANNEKTLEYLKNHPEIKELIWSGGDPLMLSNQKILTWAETFHKLGIQSMRFHTRFPVILPSRLKENFLSTLKKLTSLFDVVSFVIHINHPDELDAEIKDAIHPLRELPLNLFSQSVLLRGVNDNTDCLEKLFWSLGKMGVTPYYLHHPDRVQGADHFRLSVEKGRELTFDLRNRLPGWAIPTYVLDIPGGMGKTPLHNPERLSYGGKVLNRNGDYQNFLD